MPFLIVRTESVVKGIEEFEQKDERKFRKVRKTLGFSLKTRSTRV